MKYSNNQGLFHVEQQKVSEQSKFCQVFMTITSMG